nr:hypothetical protein BaRGS_033875 [Batillaria attramentaria]
MKRGGEIYPNNSVFYKLKSELLKGYSPDIRPVHNVSTVTNVTVKVKLGSLGDVNVREQKLSQTLYLYATWVDEFMSWDPEDYDGTTDLLVRQKDIWIPDLVLGPAMTSARKLGVDSQYYPFDEQKCNWVLYLLASDKRHVELTFKKTDDLRSVGEFSENVDEISMTRQMMSQALYLSVSWTDEFINWNPGDYGGATDFLVRQKDVWVPDLAFGPQVSSTSGKLVMLSLLSILVFALPVESGEKMSLGVTLMLAFVFQLSFVTSDLFVCSIPVAASVLLSKNRKLPKHLGKY